MPAPRSFLAIDVGNSAVKAGLWNGTAWGTARLSPDRVSTEGADVLRRLVGTTSPDAAGIASVAPAVSAQLAEVVLEVVGFDPEVVHGTMEIPSTAAPFHTTYATPETLGADRLAAAAAAYLLYGRPAGRAAVAVDAGTAITVDAVTAAGAHLGGAILPGPDALIVALARGTAQLPEVPFERPESVLGGTTVQSIQSGVSHLLIDGLSGLLDRISEYPSMADPAAAERPVVIATGGWAPWLSAHIAFDAVAPELVLDGVRLMCTNDR